MKVTEFFTPVVPENKTADGFVFEPGWSKFTSACVVGSNIMNVGIILDQLSFYIKMLRAIPGLPMVALASEAFIYVFKSLYHLAFLLHNQFSKKQIEFEYRKFGTHRYQTLGDVVCLTLFGFTIAALFGLIVANPVGAALAWAMGLSGVAINVYFDYYHQSFLAKRKKDQARESLQQQHIQYRRAVESNSDAVEVIKSSYNDACVSYLEIRHQYFVIRDAKRMYIATLIGLVFMLVCGSVAAFAPPALVPLFLVLKYTGTTMLLLINVGRFINWWKPRLKDRAVAAIGFGQQDEGELLFPVWLGSNALFSSRNDTQDCNFLPTDLKLKDGLNL